jgi:hypothetical protein
MKIFIAPHPTDGFEVKWTCPRGEYIIRKGLEDLQQQSDLQVVDSADKADFVFWIYRPHYKHQKSRELIYQYDPKKLVVIDWTDEPDEMHTDRFFAYFKRSWVYPQYDNGLCVSKFSVERPKRMFPFAYCCLPEFEYPEELERDIDVGCYLRPSDPNRQWILYTLQKFLPQCNIKYWLGPVNNDSRSNGKKVFVSEEYIKMLKRTKIVVTCNPTGWEGDTRTWEALSNGCCVLVDKMFTPYNNKPYTWEHLVEYQIGDQYSLINKIEYLIKNIDKQQQIAKDGYQLVKKYHTPQAKIQYVLNTISWLPPL